jgi:trk system potassium uptake protein TrkH
MIKYTLGWLLLFEAVFFTLPMITALVYTERDGLAFLYSALICAAVGALCIMKKPQDSTLYSKDGFAIVSLSWIALSLFGTLPFVFSSVDASFIDMLFETVSGFTTTGATVFADVESLPRCINLYRCFTHWVGGMGVLVFIMAFLPLGGAHNMHIMKAESTGPSVSKLVPRVKNTAIILYTIYIALTLTQLVMLLCGKMSFFEALNTALSTAGTGGFGFKNDSLASCSSYIQIVVTVFMLLFSINFNSYYLAMKLKFKDAFNTEVKVFLGIVFVAIAIISADTFVSGVFSNLGDAIKHSAFTVSSLISTTGFATTDFNLWPGLSKTLIVLIMFVGACAGSTGGGIKVSRIVILFKGMARELNRTIHPRQVKKLTLDSRLIDHEVIRSVNAYIICYILIFAASIALISFNEYDLVTNFTSVTAAINNIGPGLELVGPTQSFGHFDIFSKLVLIFDMLAGRLELFPMLILFSPRAWKKQ